MADTVVRSRRLDVNAPRGSGDSYLDLTRSQQDDALRWIESHFALRPPFVVAVELLRQGRVRIETFPRNPRQQRFDDTGTELVIDVRVVKANAGRPGWWQPRG